MATIKKRKQEKNENFLDREDFIAELAERAGFTKSDTRLFLEAMESIFADSITQGVDIDIRGFIHLYIQKLSSFEGVNARESKLQGKTVRQVFPESKRVVVKLGVNLRDLVRDPSKRKIQNSKNTREAITESKKELEIVSE